MKSSIIDNGDPLVAILSYHTTLIDESFVESIMLKIDNVYKTRMWVLSIFTLFGFGAGLIGARLLWPASHSFMTEHLLEQFAPLLLTLCVILLGIFVTWVFNEEFESP